MGSMGDLRPCTCSDDLVQSDDLVMLITMLIEPQEGLLTQF